MNFASRTPEALLPRSDSKNPATTCKGITSTGRSCRRSLGTSARSSPGPSPSKDRGVLAVLRDDQDDGNNAAAFYCWQHKDQAERVAQSEQNHTQLFPLPERNSIDTLVDRVGIMNIEDVSVKEKRGKRKQTQHGSPMKKNNLPADWQRMQGPLMTVPSDVVSPAAPQRPQTRKRAPRSNVKASILCCIRHVDDDENPPSRRRQHRPSSHGANRMPETPQHHAQPVAQSPVTPSQNPSPGFRRPVPITPSRTPVIPRTPTRPRLATTPQSTSSQTQTLLSLIPPHLSPKTAAELLSELSKSPSAADKAGYIYMYWLTPESDPSKPDDDAASDLLEAPSSSSRPAHDRRPSDVLQRYASQRRGPIQTKKTVLLKIGRTENVHRRLSQWEKQCSHNITLIRWYPYNPSRTPLSDTQSLPRKVPHVNKVAKLIHTELVEKRVSELAPCGSCGQKHREWFEIEASREGLRAVDEVIRKWVAWAE